MEKLLTTRRARALAGVNGETSRGQAVGEQAEQTATADRLRK